jgi:hypothetical protein
LSEGGHDANTGGKGPGGSEASRIADDGDGDGDDACSRIGADAVDGGQQSPDLVGVEHPPDIGFDLFQAAAPEVEILADMAGLKIMDRPVMLADRSLGRLDQPPGQILAASRRSCGARRNLSFARRRGWVRAKAAPVGHSGCSLVASIVSIPLM